MTILRYFSLLLFMLLGSASFAMDAFPTECVKAFRRLLSVVSSPRNAMAQKRLAPIRHDLKKLSSPPAELGLQDLTDERIDFHFKKFAQALDYNHEALSALTRNYEYAQFSKRPEDLLFQQQKQERLAVFYASMKHLHQSHASGIESSVAARILLNGPTMRPLVTTWFVDLSPLQQSWHQFLPQKSVIVQGKEAFSAFDVFFQALQRHYAFELNPSLSVPRRSSQAALEERLEQLFRDVFSAHFPTLPSREGNFGLHKDALSPFRVSGQDELRPFIRTLLETFFLSFEEHRELLRTELRSEELVEVLLDTLLTSVSVVKDYGHEQAITKLQDIKKKIVRFPKARKVASDALFQIPVHERSKDIDIMMSSLSEQYFRNQQMRETLWLVEEKVREALAGQNTLAHRNLLHVLPDLYHLLALASNRGSISNVHSLIKQAFQIPESSSHANKLFVFEIIGELDEQGRRQIQDVLSLF